MASSARYVISFVLVVLAPSCFAASSVSTTKAMLKEGAGAFIGEVMDVQVLSKSQTLESGTVQLQIKQIIAGTMPSSYVTFSYQRALEPADEESNWDLLMPQYVSLKSATSGKELVVFFTENNGTYSLYSASNAVQDASRGLFIGKIAGKLDPFRPVDGRPLELSFVISDNILGWAGSSVIKLPFDPNHACKQTSDPRSQSVFGIQQLLDPRKQSMTLVVAYDDTGICGIEAASEALLKQLGEPIPKGHFRSR
jgi:hypothetical protein